MNFDDYMTLKEWAAREGITDATARQRCIRGATPGIKVANTWFIRKDIHLEDHRKAGE